MKYKYGKEEVKKKVEIAFGMLLKNDIFLLVHDVNERSISHKLAEYLQKLFPDYHVDCEYNRQLDELEEKIRGKELIFDKKEEKLFYPKSNEAKIKDKNAHTVFPDIIVHHRGNDDNNLLIIEMKKTTNREESAKERDILKLSKYREKFSYDHVLFLELPTGNYFNPKSWQKVKVNLNGS